MRVRISTGAFLMAFALACPDPASADTYRPDTKRIRAGLARQTVLEAHPVGHPTIRQDLQGSRAAREKRDSVWNGVLIGAGIGAGAGLVWAQGGCGDDSECLGIARPIGLLVGGGIGAIIGAIADAVKR